MSLYAFTYKRMCYHYLLCNLVIYLDTTGSPGYETHHKHIIIHSLRFSFFFYAKNFLMQMYSIFFTELIDNYVTVINTYMYSPSINVL